MLLGEMELALLLKTPASLVLTQGLELGPLLGKLQRETALRRFSWQRGGASQVAGSWRSLPGSQTC